MKLSVFIASSLDGYIARENGDIDWLMKFNTKIPDGEDCGYSEFMKSIDILVLGRNTFNKVLEFGEWSYKDKKVIVMTRSHVIIPENIQNCVSIFSDSPVELVKMLKNSKIKGIYIDGGLIIQSFIQENLIDDITITMIPILIGGGKSLFGSIKDDIQLSLIDVKQYDFGAVQLKYQLDKASG